MLPRVHPAVARAQRGEPSPMSLLPQPQERESQSFHLSLTPSPLHFPVCKKVAIAPAYFGKQSSVLSILLRNLAPALKIWQLLWVRH